MTTFLELGKLNDHLFGKEMFIHSSYCLSIWVCASFSFCFEGGMWDMIVLVPDHCLSFYF